jgi:cell wall-associated NlpC family hydrolase
MTSVADPEERTGIEIMLRNSYTRRRGRLRHAAILAVLVLPVLASCSGAPRQQVRPDEPGPPPPNRREIVRFAKTFVGIPYRSGGTSRKGVDCSGLVIAVYSKFDIRLPRTSLDQSRVGDRVDRSGLKPADLLFFKTSRKNPVSHVGIYIGDGKFVHASTSEGRVRIDALNDDYYKHRFTVARRIVDG